MLDFCVVCLCPCGKETISKPLDFATATTYTAGLIAKHPGFVFRVHVNDKWAKQLRNRLTSDYEKHVASFLKDAATKLELHNPDDCDEDLLRDQR